MKLFVATLVLMMFAGTASAGTYLGGFSGGGVSGGRYLSDFGGGSTSTRSGNYTRGFRNGGVGLPGGGGSNLGFIPRRGSISRKHTAPARRAAQRALERERFIARQEAKLQQQRIVRTSRGRVAPAVQQGPRGNYAHRNVASNTVSQAAYQVFTGQRVIVNANY
jgi:hypothetical protein